jgi:hypothetical protein
MNDEALKKEMRVASSVYLNLPNWVLQIEEKVRASDAQERAILERMLELDSIAGDK